MAGAALGDTALPYGAHVALLRTAKLTSNIGNRLAPRKQLAPLG
jgi:hypothetical protein